MYVVINKCFGGFGLSRAALHRLRELGSKEALAETDIGEKYSDSDSIRESFLDSFLTDIPRNDELLIKVIREMGPEADGRHAKLRIIKVPNDVEWEIDDYDGMETIEEKHRSWG